MILAAALGLLSLAVALALGRLLARADHAAAPRPDELAALGLDDEQDNPGIAAVARTDRYLDDIAAGRPPDGDVDPWLTQMFAAYRDDARRGG